MRKVWPFVPLLQLGRCRHRGGEESHTPPKGTGGLFVHYSSIKLGERGTGGPKISGIWSLGGISPHEAALKSALGDKEKGRKMAAWDRHDSLTWPCKIWGRWQRPLWTYTGWRPCSVPAPNKNTQIDSSQHLLLSCQDGARFFIAHPLVEMLPAPC